MAKGLCPPFDPQANREGHLTPVYFGRALNNFGVRELLAGVTTPAFIVPGGAGWAMAL
jgi:peptide chain release factor 3